MKRDHPKYKKAESLALSENGEYKGWIKTSKYASNYYIIWHFYLKKEKIFVIAVEKPPRKETVQTWEAFFDLYCMNRYGCRMTQDIDEEVQLKLGMSLAVKEL